MMYWLALPIFSGRVAKSRPLLITCPYSYTS
jgi:hypothetical protein